MLTFCLNFSFPFIYRGNVIKFQRLLLHLMILDLSKILQYSSFFEWLGRLSIQNWLYQFMLFMLLYTTLFYKNQLFLAEAQLFLFLNSILTSFQPWPPLNYMLKMLLVISSLRFPDQFTSSMNIFQNTNFKISNLRLAVLIKVVFMKKVYIY